MDIIQLLNKVKMYHVLLAHKPIIKLIVIMLLMQLVVDKDLVQLMELVKLVQLMLFHA